MKKPKFWICALLIMASIWFLALSLLGNSSSTPLDYSPGPIEYPRSGIMLQEGWSLGQEAFCLAIPSKAETSGFPFIDWRGTESCGLSEFNGRAENYNTLSMILFSVAVIGLSIYAIRLLRKSH